MIVVKIVLTSIAVVFIALVVLWMIYIAGNLFLNRDKMGGEQQVRYTKTLFAFLSKIWMLGVAIMLCTIAVLLFRALSGQK